MESVIKQAMESVKGVEQPNIEDLKNAFRVLGEEASKELEAFYYEENSQEFSDLKKGFAEFVCGIGEYVAAKAQGLDVGEVIFEGKMAESFKESVNTQFRNELRGLNREIREIIKAQK